MEDDVSTGPGPHGQAVGLFKCVRKTPVSGKVIVCFEGADSFGYILREMPSEDSEYYTVGTVYLINATTP
jgi:hypothetical protein